MGDEREIKTRALNDPDLEPLWANIGKLWVRLGRRAIGPAWCRPAFPLNVPGTKFNSRPSHRQTAPSFPVRKTATPG